MKVNHDKNTGKRSFVTNKSMLDAFNNAITGIMGAVRSERNMKIHLVAAILVIFITIFLDFSRIELAILTICIILVFIAEFFNTAIEEVVDLVTQGRYSKVAKRVKDISAGAVFMTAVNAVLVGYLLMYNRVRDLFTGGGIALSRLLKSPSHLIFLSIGLVGILVILLKGVFYKKHTSHLQGGTVSGHSAVAFTLATMASILIDNFEVRLILFILAILVAESRVEAKIHTFKEVVLGAVLGIVVASLMFMSFY